VHVGAFALDEGEKVGELTTRFPGSSWRTSERESGALLTMLADTMMPEAFKHGGKEVGLATTLGFALAFLITTIE
jgi:hypothetical protein